jgi:nicotinamidase-related amidase
LLDHQTGLFQTVKDISVAELRANVIALARIATLLKIPVITTASVPDGPNGPLMPEIAEFAPHAVYVPRQGEVNAWDNEAYVKTVREIGKKTLIMAGVWTGVCVMFPALDAKAAGFNVYAVMDASGDPTEFVSRTTLARFTQAGIVPTSTNVVICVARAVARKNHGVLNRPRGATPFGRFSRRALRRGNAKSKKARNFTGMKRLGEYTKLTGSGGGWKSRSKAVSSPDLTNSAT